MKPQHCIDNTHLMRGFLHPTALHDVVKYTDFIDDLRQLHAVPTTLIICSTRDKFLEDLHAATHQTHRVVETSMTPHPFLIPTIHLLVTSETISLAFTPTLPHLRAYLATYVPHNNSASKLQSYQKPGSRTPFLAILGLVALHRSTSEHSAQGLSRTLAVAVEAATHANMKLVLAEPPSLGEDPVEPGNLMSEVQENPWKEQVPLLNGSVRVGIERSWAGRTIEVGIIVGKWCKFTKLDG